MPRHCWRLPGMTAVYRRCPGGSTSMVQRLRARVAGFGPDMIVIATAPAICSGAAPRPSCASRKPHCGACRYSGDSGCGRSARLDNAARGVAQARGRCGRARRMRRGAGSDLPTRRRAYWGGIAGLCHRVSARSSSRAAPQAADVATLPAHCLADRDHCSGTPTTTTASNSTPTVPGAEMETSRGCPYRCSFCAKENFRDRYRRRPLATILEELEGLIDAGVGYVYFIDEIFLPWRELLEALVLRPVAFRGADPHRFVARRHARSARRGRLRVDRGGGRKPDRRRVATGSTRIVAHRPKS